MENDIKTNIGSSVNENTMEETANETVEMIEIHSKEIIEKAKKQKHIKEIVISCLIFLLTIVLPVVLIIIYKLWDYIIPFFKTYIFIIIRHLWLVAIAAILFYPLKMFKYLKYWFIGIFESLYYFFEPLNNKKVSKKYNKIRRKKVKAAYLYWCRFWFLFKLLCYFIVFTILLILIFLLCFVLGHMISWMDYFWILR